MIGVKQQNRIGRVIGREYCPGSNESDSCFKRHLELDVPLAGLNPAALHKGSSP